MGRRSRLADPPTDPAPAPVQRRGVAPDVWAAALREASGDARRLQVLDDGSVVVHNRRWR